MEILESFLTIVLCICFVVIVIGDSENKYDPLTVRVVCSLVICLFYLYFFNEFQKTNRKLDEINYRIKDISQHQDFLERQKATRIIIGKP